MWNIVAYFSIQLMLNVVEPDNRVWLGRPKIRQYFLRFNPTFIVTIGGCSILGKLIAYLESSGHPKSRVVFNGIHFGSQRDVETIHYEEGISQSTFVKQNF